MKDKYKKGAKLYSELTHHNRSFIKRFSHSRRMELSQQIILQIQPKTLLDFGSGDGAIYLQISEKLKQGTEVCLYEPILFAELRQALNDKNKNKNLYISNELPEEKFELVTCFEVLEHFEGEALNSRLMEIEQLIKPGGLLVLSVPVETGLSGFLKNIMRIILRQTHPQTTFSNIIRSIFGADIKREASPDGYINSHIGFNHKKLSSKLSEHGFKKLKTINSPFPGRFLSMYKSQILYIFKT